MRGVCIKAIVYLGFLWTVSVYGISRAAAADDLPVDMIIVLDTSGSMGKIQRSASYKKVLTWVQKMGKDSDRIAVLAFGSRHQVAHPFADYKNFNPKAAVSPTLKLDKYTNLAAGLENAYYLLKTESRPDAKRAILLFSDGRIDLPGGKSAEMASEAYIRDVLLPAMKKKKIKLFAFTPKDVTSDFPFLQSIAESTDGGYFRGLPADADRFRSALIAILKKEDPVVETPTPIIKTVVVEKIKQIPQKMPETSGNWIWIVAASFGGVILIAVVVYFGIRPMIRSKTRERELVSILDEIQVLRSDLKSARRTDRSASNEVKESQ